MRVFLEINKYQRQKNYEAPLLGLAKSIYYLCLSDTGSRWRDNTFVVGGSLLGLMVRALDLPFFIADLNSIPCSR